MAQKRGLVSYWTRSRWQHTAVGHSLMSLVPLVMQLLWTDFALSETKSNSNVVYATVSYLLPTFRLEY